MARLMGRARRAQAFLFEPAKFRGDPAVLLMSDAARGCYAMLFCSGWDLPEPGVYPDDDRALSQLAMTSFETWAQVRVEVARAFDTSTPGRWVQNSMVRTHLAQNRFVASQSRSGKAAAKARWGKGKDAVRTATALDNGCEAFNPLGSGSGSGGEGKGDSPVSVLEAGRRSRTEPRARTRPPAAPAAGFRPGLIEDLETKYPTRDVRLIADKVLERHHERPFSTLNGALRGWVQSAENRDIDRKPDEQDRQETSEEIRERIRRRFTEHPNGVETR